MTLPTALLDEDNSETLTAADNVAVRVSEIDETGAMRFCKVNPKIERSHCSRADSDRVEAGIEIFKRQR
ncbi:MAG: hypothetical protein V7L25_20865 [Nostoc sp.]|uniref:hypothetical protein n=1 Tax=Nostoc sp. TaxID=1180 RepID=UPI002FF1AA7C